jgi:hypothetical protein
MDTQLAMTQARENYLAVKALLKGKTERKIAGNTLATLHEQGSIEIKFWDTVIMVIAQDGTMVLNSGGFKTVTTQARMDEYMGPHWQLSTSKGVWHLVHFLTDQGYNGEVERYIYRDGMVLHASGLVTGAADEADVKGLEQMAKRISAYAKAYAKALVGGEVPKPSNGDCFYCSHVIDGSKLTPDHGATEHLTSHMGESYFVPSMLVNAMNYKGGLMSQVAKGVVHGLWYSTPDNRQQVLASGWQLSIAADQIASVLTAYLRKELGLTS